MAYKKIYVLPLVAFLLGPITFAVTYTMAVLLDHVYPAFPYISETGSFSPESCVFGQLLNIAAFLMSLAVYVKYMQIEAYSELRPAKGISHKVNLTAAILGACSCFGLDVVANFQESNVISVHLVGAGVCFLCGTIYFCMQTWLSRKMIPDINSSRTVSVRLCLSLICVISTLTTVGPAIVSIIQFDGEDRHKWTPEDGGYKWHLTSTISEWILALTYCSFILSFVYEFRKIHIKKPVFMLTNVEPDGINNDLKY